MMRSFRFCFVAAVVLAACSIGLDQVEADAGQDQECLELFETCVDLAGESPGCTEVFEFCHGTAGATGTGGGALPGGCEQNYIDCLVEGSTADQCQPLLDACMPSGSTTGCDTLEPACTDGEASTVTTEVPPICGDDGEPCDPVDEDCDARYDLCLMVIEGGAEGGVEDGGKGSCEALRGACESGDCESAINICVRSLADADTCQELTGCESDLPGDSCEDLLGACARQDLSPDDCAGNYPDRPECFPDNPSQCPWYEQECQVEFDPSFCADGQLACDAGWLPDVFECAGFLPEACGEAGLTQTACDQVQTSCEGGFFDAENCSDTQLHEDPYAWLAEFAACNEWE